MWVPISVLAGLLCVNVVLAELEYYNAYEQRLITDQELLTFEEVNNTFWCVTEIDLPCDAEGYRKNDGSCNYLKDPIKGMGRTPFLRYLPAVYDTYTDYLLRKSVTGEELPIPRHLRTQLLSEGKAPHPYFTNNVPNFMLLYAGDMGDIHDTVAEVVWTPYCCLPQGATEPRCAPNPVPADDPVHQFSGITCFNQTKPISFQTESCASNTTLPSRITTSTVLLDLSLVYGDNPQRLAERGRLFEGGLMRYETDWEGRIWPASLVGTSVSLLNRGNETRSFDTPNVGMNGLFGLTLTGLWFYRQHNYIARELAKYNPSWDDEKLFNEARNINIAIQQQILYYELFPAMFGYQNLYDLGVISTDQGFKDMYDENYPPQQDIELGYVLRWTHTIQEGTFYLYNSNGEPYDQIESVDLTLRTGYLDQDFHIEGLTQGTFRQPCAEADYIIDPALSERMMGIGQRSADVTSNDLSKGRYFGIAPYISYINKCFGKTVSSFDDLEDFIDAERIELLKINYNSVEDVELLAGIWSEKLIPGGNVPLTFYCIVKEQLLRTIITDRFWFERPNRPHPFSAAQLAEIRKASIARLICDHGDSVTEIQPHPLYRESEESGNVIASCNNYPTIDFSVWKEETSSTSSSTTSENGSPYNSAIKCQK